MARHVQTLRQGMDVSSRPHRPVYLIHCSCGVTARDLRIGRALLKLHIAGHR